MKNYKTMKYTKEQVERLQDIYKKNLEGTYLPDELQWAYLILTGNEQPVPVRRKKQTLYAFINYEFNPNDYLEEKNSSILNRSDDNSTDQQELMVEEPKQQVIKNERVITSKPRAKNKRKVTRIKKGEQ